MARIDQRLKNSIEHYAKLANSTASLQEKVGRSRAVSNSERAIFRDIQLKLRVGAGQKILSIGVGCGQFATWWLREAHALQAEICLFDFPEVVEQIARKIVPKAKIARDKLLLVGGCFPFDASVDLTRRRFDRIDLYSVLHYTDQPQKIIESAVTLLAPGGRLLVGDIPNLDRKGRFLATLTGRKFDAAYRGVPVEEVPAYAHHRAFTKKALAGGAARLDDAFILSMLKKYRERGYDVFVLDQPSDLPFCHTREDLLICAPRA